MAHPFISLESKGLRERVATFVQSALHRTSATNIIFVCGGDGAEHLRPQFIEFMKASMPSYRPFRPEAAQEDYFEQDHAESLNLSLFERLVSDLALGIVLFAESPGSYAETGLFSALHNARRKTLVVMDAIHQGPGSFLSFGPVAVIASKSRLGAAIQLDYAKPNFEIIKERVEGRLKVSTTFRAIGATDFKQLKSIEIMSLIWFYVYFLRACSVDDLIYCFHSAFNGHARPVRIKQILSVLVGAGLVVRDGPLGLARIADSTVKLVAPSAAKTKQLEALELEMTNLLEGECDANYSEAMPHAA